MPKARFRKTTGALVLAAAVLAAPQVRAQGEPTARPLRFAIGIGGGWGWSSLSSLNTLVGDVETAVEAHGAAVEGADDTHGTAVAGLSVRAYLPWYIAAEVGGGVLYAFDTGTVSAAGSSWDVEHNELAFEVPILVGGYYPFLGQLYVAGLVGPVVTTGVMSLWDVSGGEDLNDYDTESTTCGFMGLVGVDWVPVEYFAVGLDVRYRYLVSDALKYDTDGPPLDGMTVESGHLRGDGSTDTYRIEFHGVAVEARLKVII